MSKREWYDPIEVNGLIVKRDRTAWSRKPDYPAAAQAILEIVINIPHGVQESYDVSSEVHGRNLRACIDSAIEHAGIADQFKVQMSRNNHIVFVRRLYPGE